jgi:hypothetical protein
MVRILGVIITFLVLTSEGFAISWGPAYPYTQKIEHQKVTVKAVPYAPYLGFIIPGETKVFYKKKLLYTLDNYYREPIATSDDGRYFAVINTSIFIGALIMDKDKNVHNDFDNENPIIEIFKDGKPFKNILLGEVIDKLDTLITDQYYYWKYTYDTEGYEKAEGEYNDCKEVYGKRALKKCDSSLISKERCQACNLSYQRLLKFEREKWIADNYLYVENNSLFVLTNQEYAIKLDFNTLQFEKIDIGDIVNNIAEFTPPKIKVSYAKVTYPGKFELPEIKGGIPLGEAVALLLGKSQSDYNTAAIKISVINLTIGKKGNYIKGDVWVKVCDLKTQDKEFVYNDDLKQKLLSWIKTQTFSTDNNPKGFSMYSYFGFIELN